MNKLIKRDISFSHAYDYVLKDIKDDNVSFLPDYNYVWNKFIRKKQA